MSRNSIVLLCCLSLLLFNSVKPAAAQTARERVSGGAASGNRSRAVKPEAAIGSEELKASFSNLVVEIDLFPVGQNVLELRHTLRALKMETSANRDASLTGLLEVSDDKGALFNSAKYTFKMYEGRQITDIFGSLLSGHGTMSRSVLFTKAGNYRWKLRLFEDKRELATLTAETLIGADSMPIKRSAEVKILAFTLRKNDRLPQYTVQTVNTGNALLLGYYRIDTYVNGVRVKTMYNENVSNLFPGPPPQNYVFLRTYEPDNFHAYHYSGVGIPFQKGESVKLAVSFVDVEGGILATAESDEILAE
jgi:hypothetical protein